MKINFVVSLLLVSSCLKLKATLSLGSHHLLSTNGRVAFSPASGRLLCNKGKNDAFGCTTAIMERVQRSSKPSKLMRSSNSSDRSSSLNSSSSTSLPFEKEMGISPAFNDQFFDPLNFASDEYFPRFREAELKHGRVAMLATVGMFIPDVFRGPLMKGVIITLPSNPGAKPQQIEFGLQNIEFSPVTKVKFGDIPNGLAAIGKVPLGVWAQILIAVGILELFFWKQRSPKSLPGDYGTGFFGIHDYGQHESLLENEIEIGRLAMVGFVLQVLWELLTHTTVGQPYRNILFH